MPRNKEHERTHMMAVREVREDVKEEMERALVGTALPPQKRQEVVTKVGAVIERYTSDYPHPDVLRQIESLAPGMTALIVQTAAENIRHNNEVEKLELQLKSKELELRNNELGTIKSLANRDLDSVDTGRKYGFAGFTCVLAFSSLMYYLGAHELSYAAFGVGSLGIVGQLISGGRKLNIKAEPSEETDESEKSETKAIEKVPGPNRAA